MRSPILRTAARAKEFHEHLIILNAVDHNLTGKAAAFLEPQMPVERLREAVRRPDLDDQFPITCFTRKGCGSTPQLVNCAPPSPFRQQKCSDLTDLRHRREQLRPQVETLKPDDDLRGINGYMKRLSRRKPCEVACFPSDNPDSIDRGVDSFGRDGRKYRDNSGSVDRRGPLICRAIILQGILTRVPRSSCLVA